MSFNKGARYSGYTVLLLSGFLVGHFMPHSSTTKTVLPIAVHNWPKAMPVKAIPPSHPAVVSETVTSQDRIASIEQELSAIPAGDSDSLKALADQIQEERARLTELRNRLTESSRDLTAIMASSVPDPSGRQHLSYQLRATSLNQELQDAKLAVAEQERILGTIADSNETKFMNELHSERNRRKARVNALQKAIRDLYDAEEGDLDQADGAKAARLQSWRQARLELESAYGDSLLTLQGENQAYRQIAEEGMENRKRTAELLEEKKKLEKP